MEQLESFKRRLKEVWDTPFQRAYLFVLLFGASLLLLMAPLDWALYIGLVGTTCVNWYIALKAKEITSFTSFAMIASIAFFVEVPLVTLGFFFLPGGQKSLCLFQLCSTLMLIIAMARVYSKLAKGPHEIRRATRRWAGDVNVEKAERIVEAFAYFPDRPLKRLLASCVDEKQRGVIMDGYMRLIDPLEENYCLKAFIERHTTVLVEQVV
jgi:hypothetical protein